MSDSEGSQEQVLTQLRLGEEDRLAIAQEVAKILRQPADASVQGSSTGNASSVQPSAQGISIINIKNLITIIIIKIIIIINACLLVTKLVFMIITPSRLCSYLSRNAVALSFLSINYCAIYRWG